MRNDEYRKDYDVKQDVNTTQTDPLPPFQIDPQKMLPQKTGC